jgi:hypothetical protein
MGFDVFTRSRVDKSDVIMECHDCTIRGNGNTIKGNRNKIFGNHNTIFGEGNAVHGTMNTVNSGSNPENTLPGFIGVIHGSNTVQKNQGVFNVHQNGMERSLT